ncbi:MAG: VCBS repeat-containing protein [Planctomycetes bacterium]|nr:VCBS repeat-containing protein [Planctomycetota bacterium]
MLTTLLMSAAGACLAVQDPQFEAPVRLKAGGEPVMVEAPGYAAPGWADVDGDGKRDLIVGQFNDGKLLVCRNTGKGKLADGMLAKGEWLEVEGAVAEVPGVW